MKTPWSNRIESCKRQFNTVRNEKIRQEMVSLMDNPENVLEVGAGTQELKKHLDCDYVSCDFEVGFRPDVVGDAHCLPFRNNAFDTIVTKKCPATRSGLEGGPEGDTQGGRKRADGRAGVGQGNQNSVQRARPTPKVQPSRLCSTKSGMPNLKLAKPTTDWDCSTKEILLLRRKNIRKE